MANTGPPRWWGALAERGGALPKHTHTHSISRVADLSSTTMATIDGYVLLLVPAGPIGVGSLLVVVSTI